MSFMKRVKRIFALAALMIMTVNTAHAEFYSVPQELTGYGERIYSSARSYFGRRSFSGYCGTYVKCQLRAMGIFENQYDVHGNGNQWYANFENVTQTSGGYYVYRESGSDCLDRLQEKYGTNLKNIVLSFPIQSGRSAARPGAGHAFVIYEIRDGIAYYSESFGFGGFREGQVIAEDIDSLLTRYTRRHGALTGCVMLSENEILSEEDEYLKVVEAFISALESMSESVIVA